eukprot:4240408-Pleurochrysis_carterae.AAC.1
MAPTRCHISCVYALPALDRMHAIDAIGLAHECAQHRRAHARAHLRAAQHWITFYAASIALGLDAVHKVSTRS